MKKQDLTHRLYILSTLYSSVNKLTATDFSHVSNANQYFVKLEDMGLITSVWGNKGKARVKYRFVSTTQREKAKTYLSLNSIKRCFKV